jgi:hypothetical protein
LCGATCRVTHALQGFNQLGDQGAVALADSLEKNTCLTQLELVSEESRGDDMIMHRVVVLIYFIVLFITVLSLFLFCLSVFC